MPCVHSATAGGPAPSHHLRSPRPPRGSARSTATWRRGWTASAVSPTGLRPTAPPRRSTIWRNSPPSWRRGSSPTSGGTTSWPPPGGQPPAERPNRGGRAGPAAHLVWAGRHPAAAQRAGGRAVRLALVRGPGGPSAWDRGDQVVTACGGGQFSSMVWRDRYAAASARRPTRNLLTTEVSPLRGGSLAGRGRGVE